MSVNLFSTILNTISPYTDYVNLHVKGEPLLHPNIDSILDLCYKNKIQANIVSNGTLINELKDKLLSKPALRQISFSLHCFDELAITTKDDYLKYLFSFVKEALEKTGIIISLRFWNLDKVNNENKKTNSYLIARIEEEFVLNYNLNEALQSKNSLKIFDQLYLNMDYQFAWPNIEDTTFEESKGFCYGLRDQIAILADGTVVPCCLDGEGTINLGNVFEESFSSIINSERARNIYNGFSNGQAVEMLCIKCRYKSKFR